MMEHSDYSEHVCENMPNDVSFSKDSNGYWYMEDYYSGADGVATRRVIYCPFCGEKLDE